jgi:hypothetical protein
MFAVRCAAALQELSGSDGLLVEIGPADAGVELPDAREVLAKNFSAAVVRELLPYDLGAERVHAAWQTPGGGEAAGEICLKNLALVLSRFRPPLWDQTLTPSERRVLASLVIVDEQPYAGMGTATGLRITSPGSSPELWFYDSSRSFLGRLDLEYGEYLEAALATKGAFGWQYLFTGVNLSAARFSWHRENLTAAFDRLSALFPAYSYPELRS